MARNFCCLVGFPTRHNSSGKHKTNKQKFLYCPGTKRQQDKPKILPQDEPGWDFDILPRDRPGQDCESDLYRPGT